MKLFNRSTLFSTLLIGGSLLLSQGQATAFPLSQVMKTGKVPYTAVHADWAGFTFANRAFHVDFRSHYQNGKLNEMLFYFADRNLTDQEAHKIAALAGHVALNCYNLLPERRASIQSWVSTWLIQNDSTRERTFGPLLVNMQHTSNGDVLMWFTRTGIPGKAPWINHCINR
ncbi:hypothetical protein [Deinococcus cellulosilyticus]|nr:hypothetical protein [Deinococcus cellulosilyticus]